MPTELNLWDSMGPLVMYLYADYKPLITECTLKNEIRFESLSPANPLEI